jgi:hypothetical protein
MVGPSGGCGIACQLTGRVANSGAGSKQLLGGGGSDGRLQGPNGNCWGAWGRNDDRVRGGGGEGNQKKKFRVGFSQSY